VHVKVFGENRKGGLTGFLLHFSGRSSKTSGRYLSDVFEFMKNKETKRFI